MNKLLHIGEQYRKNKLDVLKLIDQKIIKRNVLWNYLKQHNQIKDQEWKFVKYEELKSCLIVFWQKQQLLQKPLQVTEICALLSPLMRTRFNTSEIAVLKNKLCDHLQNCIQNIGNIHVLIVKNHIERTSSINDPQIKSKVAILKQYLKSQKMLLLKKLVQTKGSVSNDEKHIYLSLNNIHIDYFDHEKVNQEFNDIFQAHRNMFLLNEIKRKSSLYEKSSFQF